MADSDHSANGPDMVPLAQYRGAVPPAPDWFREAVETPYETRWIEVEGARIHYQRWGDSTKPGLLLVHGNGAHAHWYDFIAPYFAADYCVVAMTFGGMGDSDHRAAYSLEQFGAEQMRVCEDSGLFDGGRKPVIVAHSFGGFITMGTASRFSERFAGVMIVDSPVRPPEDAWEGPPERNSPNRIYADLPSALGRFRLAPPQPCDNHFILDHIARHSLKQMTTEAGQSGWTWKFDAFIWKRFDEMSDPRAMVTAIRCPLAFMRGEQSILIPERIWSFMRNLRPDATMISLPEAQHHVMLDQPLAFIAAVRTQLAAWGA